MIFFYFTAFDNSGSILIEINAPHDFGVRCIISQLYSEEKSLATINSKDGQLSSKTKSQT